jgi:hypothetical protein
VARNFPIVSTLCAALILGCLGRPAPLCAQDAWAREGSAQGRSSREGSAQAPEEDASEKAEDLVEQTLGSDIATASYYELVAWCRELGLSDAGTRQALQQRLYGYYGVSAPKEEVTEGKKRLLEIKSAVETQYFTVEEVDEDYVLLLGDVLVEIQEEEATHRIRAHRILVNQTENILSAEGGIEYTLIKGDEEEVFRGERLTFDVESWEGVFFGGGMQADRTVGGETIRFRFSGESISRLEGNTVVIDRGKITSCDVEGDPHYHIRARKIWVLAPNEWAILHAVLYVGRVPLLYLPFFFRPGDEFFFHPAIGYRDREGNFVQTTTYLIGQKKRSSSALSFLAATEQSTTQYEVERRGMFLRQIPDKPIQVQENRFLKVMIDLYARLGAFVGVEGSLPPNVDFKGGIARSRTVYYSPYPPSAPQVYFYTPWIPPDFESSWNESYVFGLRLPFRFGLESSWSLGSGPYRFSGKFEYFSDPFFTSDFYNRAEDTGLTRLVGIEPIEDTVTEGETRNLTWELSGRTDFSERLDTPLVKTLSLTNISANLFWQSKQNEELTGLDEDYDPSRQFYYPVSLKLPSASFQMRGDLASFSLPRVEGAAKASAERTPVPADLRLPEVTDAGDQRDGDQRDREQTAGEEGMGEEEAGEQRAVAGKTHPVLRTPEPKQSVPVSLQKTPLQFRLSYQIRPSLNVEQSFNTEEWDVPEEVTYDLKYTSFDTQGTSSLDYSMRVLENVLALSGNFALAGNFRSRRRQSFPAGAEWDNLVKSDQQYTQFNAKFTQGLDYFPFADDPIFGKTSLSYDVGSTFYRYVQYDALTASGEYYGEAIEWSDEWFTLHSAQAALRWRLFERDNSLSLSSQLPPRRGSFTGNLQFQIWLLTTTVNSVFQDTGAQANDWGDWGDWRFQPLVLRETLDLGEEVNFSEELRFDIEGFRETGSGLLSRSLTRVDLWDLFASLTYEWMEPLEFVASDWVPSGEPPAFLPSYVTVGYSHTGRERLFWKNRVRVSTSIDTSWSMNIQQFTDNSLEFSFTFDFWLHRFLKLSLTTSSYNNQTFKYFPGMVDKLNVPEFEYVDPIRDLLDSLNFFDEAARRRSSFNWRSVTVEAVHYLHDWNLRLSYQGRPVLDEAAVPKQYVWRNNFAVVLQWLPIPEIRSNPKVEWDKDKNEYVFSLRG